MILLVSILKMYLGGEMFRVVRECRGRQGIQDFFLFKKEIIFDHLKDFRI